MLTWLKTHPRSTAALALAVLLLCAFAVGRYSAPKGSVRVETHETVKTVTVEDTQSKEMVRVLTAQLTELKRNMHRVTHTITKPDGTSDTTTVVDSVERYTTDTRSAVAVDTATHVQKRTEQVTEKTSTKVTDVPKAQWHASALVGLDVPAALHGSLKPVYGAHVERRLVGPFFAGAWGLGGASLGVGGISLGLEW